MTSITVSVAQFVSSRNLSVTEHSSYYHSTLHYTHRGGGQHIATGGCQPALQLIQDEVLSLFFALQLS